MRWGGRRWKDGKREVGPGDGEQGYKEQRMDSFLFLLFYRFSFTAGNTLFYASPVGSPHSASSAASAGSSPWGVACRLDAAALQPSAFFVALPPSPPVVSSSKQPRMSARSSACERIHAAGLLLESSVHYDNSRDESAGVASSIRESARTLLSCILNKRRPFAARKDFRLQSPSCSPESL